MLVKDSDFYCGNASGSPCQLALKNQIPSQYVHPSTKQCNYSVDTSQFATSSELNSLKTSVSSGKSLVASAVTGKDVSTAADASFQTIANNIKNIPGVKTTASVTSELGLAAVVASSVLQFRIVSFDGTLLICEVYYDGRNGGTYWTLTFTLS